MKYFIRNVVIIGLFSIPQLAYPGSITDTYTDGDTLTTTTLDNIKSAVNDNDSNISAWFSGDGSDGDLTVSSVLDWSVTPPSNIMLQNITIDPGQVFKVPAGTIIRCSGTFTNNGTLTVLAGAVAEGTFGKLSAQNGPSDSMTSVAHPGDTPGTASLGDSHDGSISPQTEIYGGRPGKAIPKAVAITSFSNFRIGGGAGAGYTSLGTRGGGLVKIYCGGPVINAGLITATGNSAANDSIGGGGGGIVILASRTLVDNFAGTIDVSGGNGRTAVNSFGGNGGGGGGIIVMVSPTTPLAGTEIVSGGSGGTNTGTVIANVRTAGAGGGGSGGRGGSGGDVGFTGARSIAEDGTIGYTITLTIDPLFIAR